MVIEDALVEFALGAEPTAAARRMMRLSLLDWAACGIAGTGEEVSRILRHRCLSDAGAPEASVIGSDGKIPAGAAALVNGTTSHALDYDDTHFAHIGHPSVAVIPAALAIAEKSSNSGEDFLDAALIGAEASVRVGMWLGRSHYQAGFHQTATAGTFGATLSAARLLRLSADQTAHALGLASTMASGSKSQFGSMGKALNAGLAAAGGVQAAELAATGMQSNLSAMSGAQGFGVGHRGEANENALDRLGENWLFEGVSHKFHACCHGLHATLEALATLRGQFDAPDVVGVTITTHPRWQSVCNQSSPTTALAAKFSYRQVVAMALAELDTAALASFSDETANDPRLVALRECVSVEFEPAIAETGAQVQVKLHNGSHLVAEYDLSAPLGVDERQDKLLAKSGVLIGQSRTDTLWSAIGPAVDFPKLISAMNG